MLNFAIIDDNPRSVEQMSKMLETIFMRHDFDGQLCYQTSNVDEFMSYLSNNKIDVLLLDINLKSYLNGLEIAEKVRKQNKNCYFIFTTAYIEYSLIAYRYKTFDFISKPITLERLEDSIIRLFDDVKGSNRKFIKLDNKNTIIDENEIKYIERNGMKLVFHTNSRDYEVYSSFNKIQNKLPNNFIRCHKSFIANINNISKVEFTNNTIYFQDSFCDIGPKYKAKFMETMNNTFNFK